MTVYNLSAAGLVKAAQDAINNGTMKIAKFEFDAGIEANRTIAAHGTGVILPAGAPYSTTGGKAIVPKINTPESTSITLTEDREITCTVAVAALTAGKLTGVLIYIAP